MTATVYLSGPMTGYENYNREAFHRAAAHLIDKGYDVVNPAAEDDALTVEDQLAMSHADYLRRDIVLLLDCDLIYTLPGWRHSKGATLEMAVARGCGIDRLKDADVDTWRTFEGQPKPEPVEIVDEDAPEWEHALACDPLQGDGHGRAWCGHGVQISGSSDPILRLPEYDRREAEVEGLDELAARLQAQGPDEFPTGYYRHVAEERLRHDSPRPGDKFPNVAYVRDMTGVTAAELAANVRRVSSTGLSVAEVAEAVNAHYVATADGRGSE